MKKLGFVITFLLVVVIVVVSGCIGQTQSISDNISNTQKYTEINKNTSDPQSQYYDQLNDSFNEIDSLDNLTE